MKNSVSAIILAGGGSTRMKGVNKQFLELNGVPVLIKSTLVFEQCDVVKEIIIVAQECMINEIRSLCSKYAVTKVTHICTGGETRALSVVSGLQYVSDHCDYLAIHDGARPLVSEKVVSEALTLAFQKGAAIPCVPVKDTVKVASRGIVAATPDRDNLLIVQTPQVFKKSLYLEALGKLDKEKASLVTDDSSLLELAGIPVFISGGDYKNIKITTPEDVEVALSLISGKEEK